MGFLTGRLSATIETVLLPVAIAKDVVDVVSGNETETTKYLLRTIKEDVEGAIDDLEDGDLL